MHFGQPSRDSAILSQPGDAHAPASLAMVLVVGCVGESV